jgi:hypothetical protein
LDARGVTVKSVQKMGTLEEFFKAGQESWLADVQVENDFRMGVPIACGRAAENAREP